MNVSLTPDLERFVREALRLLIARDRDEESYRVAEGRTAYATPSDEAPLRAASARLRQALEMLHLSHSLMRQNLRREDPAASEAEIEGS